MAENKCWCVLFFLLFQNFRKLLASHAETDRTTGTADLTTIAADGNERAAVTTDPANVAGDGTEPATVAGDGTEPALVAADGMEPTMVTADGPSGEEDVGGMVAEQTGDVVQSDGQHQTSEASDGEEGVNSPEVVANPLKPSKERYYPVCISVWRVHVCTCGSICV